MRVMSIWRSAIVALAVILGVVTSPSALGSTGLVAEAAAGVPGRVARPTTRAIDQKVTVNWTRPVTGGSPIVDFDIRVRTVGRSWKYHGGPNLTATSVLVKGLVNGRSYEVQVRAKNAIGAGGWSVTEKFSPRPSRFRTIPLGKKLPTGGQCAKWVRTVPENRPDNKTPNHTTGASSHDLVPRVRGNFVGTTDEILQWAACKWGLNENTVRAQAAVESWWRQSTGGDWTYDPSQCHPRVRDQSPCPESLGLYQVRYAYHTEAFEDANAIDSSAYNVEYGLSVWRRCYRGDFDWLNTVERGREYKKGDATGCLGVWFSGRWYTPAAVDYIDRVLEYRRTRVWEESHF